MGRGSSSTDQLGATDFATRHVGGRGSLSVVAMRYQDLSPFGPQTGDPALGVVLTSAMRSAYGAKTDAELEAVVGRFVAEHEEHLRFVFRRAEKDPAANPLLRQPEVLMVLERLENDRTGLLRAWPGSISTRALTSLSETWGRALF